MAGEGGHLVVLHPDIVLDDAAIAGPGAQDVSLPGEGAHARRVSRHRANLHSFRKFRGRKMANEAQAIMYVSYNSIRHARHAVISLTPHQRSSSATTMLTSQRVSHTGQPYENGVNVLTRLFRVCISRHTLTFGEL